jgi:Ni/Co efflux regulator RcnB
MKKIIYSIFAFTFILASCNNATDTEQGHNHETHPHEEGATHEHGTHEHEDGEVHEDHDHHHDQEEFNVSDTLKK